MSSLTREIKKTLQNENLVRHGLLDKVKHLLSFKKVGLIRVKSFGLGFGGQSDSEHFSRNE